MKFLRYFIFALPLIFPTPSQAQALDSPDTGTFPVKDDAYSKEKKQNQEEKQLIMQKEEEREEEKLDSFGNDIYNENVDPADYKVDEPKKP